MGYSKGGGKWLLLIVKYIEGRLVLENSSSGGIYVQQERWEMVAINSIKDEQEQKIIEKMDIYDKSNDCNEQY